MHGGDGSGREGQKRAKESSRATPGRQWPDWCQAVQRAVSGWPRVCLRVLLSLLSVPAGDVRFRQDEDGDVPFG